MPLTLVPKQYLLPVLPPARLEPPIFTLGRLRLTAQRLYLAIQPAYGPFFIHLAKLATWKDKKTSFIYCTVCRNSFLCVRILIVGNLSRSFG